MSTDTQHSDMAAYVLGVLSNRETDSFEAHLAACHGCAEEVASMLPVVGLLEHVDPVTLLDRAEPRPTGRILRYAGALHRRVRTAPRHGRLAQPANRPALIPIAAGIVVVLTAVVSYAVGAGSVSTGEPVAGPSASAPATAPTTAPTTQTARAGREVTATDPATGVHAQLLLASTPWGTQIEMSLSGVSGPRQCELVAVDAAGTSTVVASWSVPESGYGVIGQPEPLSIHAATAAAVATTTRYEVRVIEPDGLRTTLIAVPL